MTHEDYMRLALEEARLALATGDVPVGCVIAGWRRFIHGLL